MSFYHVECLSQNMLQAKDVCKTSVRPSSHTNMMLGFKLRVYYLGAAPISQVFQGNTAVCRNNIHIG